MPGKRLSRRTAVVGVGTTAYGKLPEHDAYDLGVWALRVGHLVWYGPD